MKEVGGGELEEMEDKKNSIRHDGESYHSRNVYDDRNRKTKYSHIESDCSNSCADDTTNRKSRGEIGDDEYSTGDNNNDNTFYSKEGESKQFFSEDGESKLVREGELSSYNYEGKPHHNCNSYDDQDRKSECSHKESDYSNSCADDATTYAKSRGEIGDDEYSTRDGDNNSYSKSEPESYYSEGSNSFDSDNSESYYEGESESYFSEGRESEYLSNENSIYSDDGDTSDKSVSNNLPEVHQLEVQSEDGERSSSNIDSQNKKENANELQANKKILQIDMDKAHHEYIQSRHSSDEERISNSHNLPNQSYSNSFLSINNNYEGKSRKFPESHPSNRSKNDDDEDNSRSPKLIIEGDIKFVTSAMIEQASIQGEMNMSDAITNARNLPSFIDDFDEDLSPPTIKSSKRFEKSSIEINDDLQNARCFNDHRINNNFFGLSKTNEQFIGDVGIDSLLGESFSRGAESSDCNNKFSFEGEGESSHDINIDANKNNELLATVEDKPILEERKEEKNEDFESRIMHDDELFHDERIEAETVDTVHEEESSLDTSIVLVEHNKSLTKQRDKLFHAERKEAKTVDVVREGGSPKDVNAVANEDNQSPIVQSDKQYHERTEGETGLAANSLMHSNEEGKPREIFNQDMIERKSNNFVFESSNGVGGSDVEDTCFQGSDEVILNREEEMECRESLPGCAKEETRPLKYDRASGRYSDNFIDKTEGAIKLNDVDKSVNEVLTFNSMNRDSSESSISSGQDSKSLGSINKQLSDHTPINSFGNSNDTYSDISRGGVENANQVNGIDSSGNEILTLNDFDYDSFKPSIASGQDSSLRNDEKRSSDLTRINNISRNNQSYSDVSKGVIEDANQVNGVDSGGNEKLMLNNMDHDSSKSSTSSRQNFVSFENDDKKSSDRIRTNNLSSNNDTNYVVSKEVTDEVNQVYDKTLVTEVDVLDNMQDSSESSNSSSMSNEEFDRTKDDAVDETIFILNEMDEDTVRKNSNNFILIKNDTNKRDKQVLDDRKKEEIESFQSSYECSDLFHDNSFKSRSINQNKSTFPLVMDEDNHASSSDDGHVSLSSLNDMESGSFDDLVLKESHDFPEKSKGSFKSSQNESDELKLHHEKDVSFSPPNNDEDLSESFYNGSVDSAVSEHIRPFSDSKNFSSHHDSKISTYTEASDMSDSNSEFKSSSSDHTANISDSNDKSPFTSVDDRVVTSELQNESIDQNLSGSINEGSVESRGLKHCEHSFLHHDSKFMSAYTERSNSGTSYSDNRNLSSKYDSFCENSEDSRLSKQSSSGYIESSLSHHDSKISSPRAGSSSDNKSISSNYNKSSDRSDNNFEASMMIGDVFGQPNELFDDFKTDDQLSNESSNDAKPTKQDAELQQDSTPSTTNLQVPPIDVELNIEQKDYTTKKLYDSTINRERNRQPKCSVEQEKNKKKKRKKKRKKTRREAKSPALLDFAAHVNETILDLEVQLESNVENVDSSANHLIHGFDALLGIFLQLSDELELIATFSKFKKEKQEEALVHVHALKAILSFADTFDQLFADLKPILLDCFDEDPDEYMDDIIYRLNSLVDLICETTHSVGEKQEWNERTETTYVTLLELIERDSLDLICYFDDVDTPNQGISTNVYEALSATGHIEELRALQNTEDSRLFRQICYEVLLTTGQWCPDVSVLMEICDIDPELLEEEPDQDYLEEGELAPIPQAVEHTLDKVNGETLHRSDVFASILRRILPPRAVTDTTLRHNFTSIRNTMQSPLGLSTTNIVSISSVPEILNDPNALGLSGVGKTTMAAMIAEHTDVRRYFIDGVVWIYVGDEELNYSRYTQCLRELVAQLDFYDGVPLFAELLHTPGETLSKRRRREEGFMIYARDTIAGLLQDRSVLIILDDVCFEPDMDWFDFAPMPDESVDGEDNNCALVITTRHRSLLPAADTVEIDTLEEVDAVSLLIQESGQLSHTLMESMEARSVVRKCANHPLAVKSVGRWLNLKHATAGVTSSAEGMHSEVIKSMDKILKAGDNTGSDMMYEILGMSLSPTINGGPTNIIKFCFAAFITVFCDHHHLSDFSLTEPNPIIPMDMVELLFETLLEMYEVSLLKRGSLFYAQKHEAAILIPEALTALSVFKVVTYSDAEDDEDNPEDEQKFLQVMHSIHHEYGEYLANDDLSLRDFTKDAERQWNRALCEAYLSSLKAWDMDLDIAAHLYALEMIISHMIRGDMFSAAGNLLCDMTFIRSRLISLGRENSTKRHIKDCETLYVKMRERRHRGIKQDPHQVMKRAYQALGKQLAIDDEDELIEDSQIKNVEVARSRYEIGFSLAENRCWDAAITHWKISQELLASALGTVEVVAGIFYNLGVVYSEINEYEQALDSLKRCLKIRGPIHGEEHILYAQTIQKIGDIFLSMSDYHEALEAYQWALDVMYKEPDHHRIEIGEILDSKGTIHYGKGEIEEALQCHQEALRSKQEDLGEDHPELAATYHHIGNCLSDQGNIDYAIIHFEEAIRLKELDTESGFERDADVLTIEGILNNLEGNQEQGLECYEKALQVLVSKAPHQNKEKIASLLHLIGCVYLMSGEQEKGMKLFEESLQARRKVLGFIHLDVASTLFNMAFLHQTCNRLDKALRCLEEALKIRQLRLPDSEKVAVTHEKIGSLARAIGKSKKAQIAFEEALKIRKLIHGDQHEAVAIVLHELGDLMDDLGEYESAMSFYIDCLDIRRSRLGLDDVAVGETLYSMGYTLHNNEEPERALVCFVEALSIRRYQLGEDSKEVGDTLNMMGFLKAKRGELDDALTLLWDALRIRKLQNDNIKVSETLKNIGNVHREIGELELAIECYEESLRIRRDEFETDHEKTADALIAMGNVLSDMQRSGEARKAYQEALKIRTNMFSEHDESVATVLQYLGTMEFRLNNYEKARDLLTEFIRIRRENNTKDDGDYVNVLFMLGNIHKMEGKEAEAKLCWNEAYLLFRELGLTETNPQIAEVMDSLLNVKHLEDQETEPNPKRSLFSKVTEKLTAKDKFDDGLHQKGRKRRNGKGFKL